MANHTFFTYPQRTQETQHNDNELYLETTDNMTTKTDNNKTDTHTIHFQTSLLLEHAETDNINTEKYIHIIKLIRTSHTSTGCTLI